MITINATGPTVACSRCSYDLRGTVIGGTCPECGLPVHASVSGVRVEGKYLVIRDGAVLPARCVITNEDVNSKPIDRTLCWSHPALALLIPINILVYLIVLLIVQKKCRVKYYLSGSQKIRRLMKIALAFLVSIIAFAAAIALAMDDHWIGLIVGLVVCVIGIMSALVFSNTVRIAKMKKGEFWIKGASPLFLQSLTDQD